MTPSILRPTRRRATRALLPALCIALASCATKPLSQLDWLSLQTSHYEFWSSLSDAETARLATELERFRAAAGFIWGRELPAPPVRTRVYAFDDRSVGRPFAYRGQRSYLLPRQRGDVIVLRTGGGWEGDATTDLQLEYARRLFWNAAPDALPPWFEEGMAQLASTLENRGDGVIVGAPRGDHVRRLRQSQWIPFPRLLGASDLVGWSSHERELFEAESWALCHYLVFSEARRGGSQAALARFRTLLERGSAPAEAARAAFGEPSGLERDVWQHVRADKLDMLSVPAPPSDLRPEMRAVPKEEILEQLGVLALAIGESELAERLLERALEPGDGSARAMAALGDVLEGQGDTEAADARYRSALAAAPNDPIVQLGFAQLLRSRAAATPDPAPRAALLARAREHYQRATLLEPDLPEPHAGLAASHLLPGEDPSAGRLEARRARTLLPGDAEIRLLEARLALAAGDREAARREAARSLTRARTPKDVEAARALLEQIDSLAAIR